MATIQTVRTMPTVTSQRYYSGSCCSVTCGQSGGHAESRSGLNESNLLPSLTTRQHKIVHCDLITQLCFLFPQILKDSIPH